MGVTGSAPLHRRHSFVHSLIPWSSQHATRHQGQAFPAPTHSAYACGMLANAEWQDAWSRGTASQTLGIRLWYSTAIPFHNVSLQHGHNTLPSHPCTSSLSIFHDRKRPCCAFCDHATTRGQECRRLRGRHCWLGEMADCNVQCLVPTHET